jgi:hypothetical protein
MLVYGQQISQVGFNTSAAMTCLNFRLISLSVAMIVE